TRRVDHRFHVRHSVVIQVTVELIREAAAINGEDLNKVEIRCAFNRFNFDVVKRVLKRFHRHLSSLSKIKPGATAGLGADLWENYRPSRVTCFFGFDAPFFWMTAKTPATTTRPTRTAKYSMRAFPFL